MRSRVRANHGAVTRSFDLQQTSLLFTVERIHGSKQAPALDQPRLKIEVNVEHENQIFGFQVSANG